MMIANVYTVYDSKAEAYLSPFLMQSRGVALRGFQDVCNDPSTNFFKHPQDFCLFEIGFFDFAKGEYLMHQTKVSLGLAIEFKKPDLSTANVKSLQGSV